MRFTLVVGSPGSGKTVLLADWLASRPQRKAAWVNCDVADADPVRFVYAVIESLRRACGDANLGEDARQLLTVDGEVSADALAALADDLEHFEASVVLVVNDFHLTGTHCTDALELLLEYRPPSLQIAVATRVDPRLRLHRMRANGELAELRDSDLSFSIEETRSFLSAYGVELGESELTLVHERSEGWAAGLQMAAIAIQSSPDPVGAAARVELKAHTVAGYFLDELLYQQPREVAEFMLATSILDELSGPACAAVAGEGSTGLLEQLRNSHMFVMLVDREARTYRYHHLIKDVLQAELHARQPARERESHAAAAGYFVDTGDIGRAARHLIAAGEPTAAFSLWSEWFVRDFANNPAPRGEFDLASVQPELYAGVPEILVPLAAELLLRGAIEGGARALALAEQAASEPDRQPENTVRLTTVRAMHCFLVGEMHEALAHRETVRRTELPEGVMSDWIAVLDALAMYGHTYLGEFDQARRLAETVASSPAGGPPVAEVLCPGVMSQVAWAEGALEEAGDLAGRSLATAGRLGFDRHYFAFSATRTSALLALERRDLSAASDLTEFSLSSLVTGRPLFDFLTQLDRSRIWAAGGNPDEALASLPAARAALRSDHSVLRGQADELESRFRLALGDHAGAAQAAERLPEDRRIVMSAIIALAAGDPRSAAVILQGAPSPGATVRAHLELRLLLAAVAISQESSQAPRMIREALAIVDRHGFVQTVLDTAPQVVESLISESARYPGTDNLAAVIAAGLEVRKLTMVRPEHGALADPLTDAEIRVLEKLPQRLTYADMAADLYLSLNTVKTHLRHTYMKLGVSSRSAAVKRATSMGLI